jgi:hypothetical protein
VPKLASQDDEHPPAVMWQVQTGRPRSKDNVRSWERTRISQLLVFYRKIGPCRTNTRRTNRFSKEFRDRGDPQERIKDWVWISNDSHAMTT